MVLQPRFGRVLRHVSKQLKLLDFIHDRRRLCIVPNADLEGGVFFRPISMSVGFEDAAR